MPQLYMIIPVGLDGGRPDQGLPPGHEHPGNRPPGSWGGPVDPGWGGGPPDHAWWGGRPDRPDQGLPGGGYPSGQPIVPPQGGNVVPETSINRCRRRRIFIRSMSSRFGIPRRPAGRRSPTRLGDACGEGFR